MSPAAIRVGSGAAVGDGDGVASTPTEADGAAEAGAGGADRTDGDGDGEGDAGPAHAASARRMPAATAAGWRMRPEGTPLPERDTLRHLPDAAGCGEAYEA